MSPTRRVLLCGVILTCGLAAQAGLEEMNKIERPPLRAALASIPLDLGDWVGRDEPVPPEIIEKAQTTDYLSREYESKTHSGRRLKLWINYSRFGDNLRHTPEICLPSGGWKKVEAECRVLSIPCGQDRALTLSRLAYTQGTLVQAVGFWYYIFGEGALETYVRRFPITSRSSHGRTTRGSSMTVEVFSVGEGVPDDALLMDFARSLLGALESILPVDRAEYHVP
jgi:Protein of unknown function (DUF3485)